MEVLASGGGCLLGRGPEDKVSQCDKIRLGAAGCSPGGAAVRVSLRVGSGA